MGRREWLSMSKLEGICGVDKIEGICGMDKIEGICGVGKIEGICGVGKERKGHTMKGEGVVDAKMSEEEEERAYRMNWTFPSTHDGMALIKLSHQSSLSRSHHYHDHYHDHDHLRKLFQGNFTNSPIVPSHPASLHTLSSQSNAC